MSDSFDIVGLAGKLSLDVAGAGAAIEASRHGRLARVPSSVVDKLDTSTVMGRHHAYGVLFGIRLAIDRVESAYDVANERPHKPEQVFRHHEIPSVYGDRLPWLVTAATLDWFEAITGLTPVFKPWIIDGLVLVYILETGKHLHLLADEDLAHTELSRERIMRDARHALFYDAYKLKPRDEERTDAGRVRIFRTAEGLGASRAMLLPDFDYDAARASGCLSVPSRDTMVIGRPVDVEHSDKIFARVAQITENLVSSEAFPLSSMVCRLDTDAITPGPPVGALPLPGERREIRPPDGLRLEETTAS